MTERRSTLARTRSAMDIAIIHSNQNTRSGSTFPQAARFMDPKQAMNPCGQHGKHTEAVFTFRGRPMRWGNTKVWRARWCVPKIGNFRCMICATRGRLGIGKVVRRRNELQRLGSWQSSSMVERYAHLAPDHLAAAANRLDLFS